MASGRDPVRWEQIVDVSLKASNPEGLLSLVNQGVGVPARPHAGGGRPGTEGVYRFVPRVRGCLSPGWAHNSSSVKLSGPGSKSLSSKLGGCIVLVAHTFIALQLVCSKAQPGYGTQRIHQPRFQQVDQGQYPLNGCPLCPLSQMPGPVGSLQDVTRLNPSGTERGPGAPVPAKEAPARSVPAAMLRALLRVGLPCRWSTSLPPASFFSIQPCHLIYWPFLYCTTH